LLHTFRLIATPGGLRPQRNSRPYASPNPHCLLEAVLRSLKILFTFLVIRRTEFAFSVWFQIEERGRNMATMKVKCTRGSQLYTFELMEKGSTQPEDWRAGRATTSISQSSASTEP
tara:strand:+ start:839 stop:1186 length:348 start_codon:yes stop_codon:yes gene_type:complete